MKLNNLSRLTALLMALMLLTTSIVWAEGGFSLDDFTLSQYLAMTQSALEDYCATDEYHDEALSLTEMTPPEAYAYLSSVYSADADNTVCENIMLHYAAHVDLGQHAFTLCSCMPNDGVFPFTYPAGSERHAEECPWHKTAVEYDTHEYSVVGANATADIKVPAGAFSSNFVLYAEHVTNPTKLAAVDAALAALAEEIGVTAVGAFDINFNSPVDGSKTHPAEPVELTFTVPTTAITTTEEDGTTYTPDFLGVLHMKDNGDGTYTAEPVGEALTVDPAAENQVLAVEGTEFSIYVVVDGVNTTEVTNRAVYLDPGESITLHNDARNWNSNYTPSGDTNSFVYNMVGRNLTITAGNTSAQRVMTFTYTETFLEFVVSRETITIYVNPPSDVTFNANEGAGGPATIKAEGGYFVFPTPEEIGITAPDGYEFAGWSVDASGRGDNYSANVQGEIHYGTYFFAIWYTKNTSQTTPAYFFIRVDSTGEIRPEPAVYDTVSYYPKADNEFQNAPHEQYNLGAIYTPVGINNNLDAVEANIAAYPDANDIKAMGVPFNPETQEVVWYVIKFNTHQYGLADDWHVDGVIRDKAAYYVAYHSNGGVTTEVPGNKPYLPGATVTIEYDPIPSRAGYEFLGWDKDPEADAPTYSNINNPETFTMPENDVDLYAIWRPSDSTPYTVEHYLCDVDGEVIDAKDNPYVETKYDTTDKKVTAESINFPGYEFIPDDERNVLSGTVSAEPPLVLKLYYKPSVSTLTINKEGMDEGESAIFTVTAYTKAGGTETPETFTVVVPNGGSVTLSDLLIDKKYTVTEQTGWTWRYESKVTDGDASSTIAFGGSSVTFTNTKEIEQWLSTEAAVHNNFSVNSTETTTR